MGEQYPLRPISLRFVDPEIEREYRKVDIDQNRPMIRAYLIAAAALYLAFGFLDVHVAGAATARLLFIRYGLICPLLVAIAMSTYLPRFVRHAQFLLTVATAAPGLGIVYMTAVLDGPARGEYYAGLIMVVIYGSALVRLRPSNAFVVSVTLIALYQVVAISINPIPATELLSNDFFLIMAASVGLFSGFLQEVALRNNFRSTKLLELKNQESEHLLLQAHAANRAKDDFVANMSHELRTPLNAIIGFSEIMEDQLYGRLGDARYEEYAGYIQRSGKHLLEIINSVLDFAKADAGKLELHETSFELDRCIADVCAMCSELAKSASVRLVPASDAGLVILADERLIRQSLINLISNAIKFSSSNSAVEVAAEHTLREVAISITDHGIGIAEENIQRILRPFEQVENTYSRAHGGTGLGLPLAQKFIELHGGRLAIASRLGEGTTVTLYLPANRLRAPPKAPADAVPALRMVS